MKTELVYILDMSGSMTDKAQETVGGYNQMIRDNKQLDDEAYVTTVFFDNRYITFQDRKPIKEADLITDEYKPTGMTALFDAVGRTINSIQANKEDKVLVTIITDGLENASKEWNGKKVKELIEAKKKEDWVITFLGTNIDVDKMADTLGVDASLRKNYTKLDTVYSAMSSMAMKARGATSKDAVMYEACADLKDIE